MDIDLIFGDLGAGMSESDWAKHVVTFRSGGQETDFAGPLTIVRNHARLNYQLALGHPNAAQLLNGAELMGRVAHYDEWSSPANFMFRCDPEFDFVVHATKLITDIPGQNDIFRSGILPGGPKASNRPPNEQSMLWLRWDRTTSQLSGSLLPHIANAEEGVVTEAETRLNWTPTEYKLRTASQRPADRVPDIHIARGDVAPGALVRRNCSWYREKVEPSQFRSGGHLIGFHFVFGKVEARRMTDLAARDEAVICISVVRSTGQVKFWPGSSGFCGPLPSETVLAQARVGRVDVDCALPARHRPCEQRSTR